MHALAAAGATAFAAGLHARRAWADAAAARGGVETLDFEGFDASRQRPVPVRLYLPTLGQRSAAGAAGGVLARHRRLALRLPLPGRATGPRTAGPACTCSMWAATARCGAATCWRWSTAARCRQRCRGHRPRARPALRARPVAGRRAGAAPRRQAHRRRRPFLRRQHHAAGGRRAGRAAGARGGAARPARARRARCFRRRRSMARRPSAASSAGVDLPSLHVTATEDDIRIPGYLLGRRGPHRGLRRHRRPRPRRWRCSKAARTASSPTAPAPAAWCSTRQVKAATQELTLAFLQRRVRRRRSRAAGLAGATCRHPGAFQRRGGMTAPPHRSNRLPCWPSGSAAPTPSTRAGSGAATPSTRRSARALRRRSADALAGRLDVWAARPEGALALILAAGPVHAQHALAANRRPLPATRRRWGWRGSW